MNPVKNRIPEYTWSITRANSSLCIDNKYTDILQSKALAYSIVFTILFLKFSSSPGIAAKPNSPFVTSPVMTVLKLKLIRFF